MYTCPMHPEVQNEREGMCPECGMRLVPEDKASPMCCTHEAHAEKKHGEHKHDKHAGHSTAMFFRKFWISLVLTVPVVLYADIVEKIFKWSPPLLEIACPAPNLFWCGGNWKLKILIPAVLGSAVFFYGGWVFLAGAWREIRGRLPGMMTLIAIAISAAYLWSVYAAFAGAEALFWELTTLITIMLLGHWLEMRAVSGAQGALKELSKLLPDTAEVIRGENIETIQLSELRESDVMLVRPGAKIPADGVIVNGESDVNESMVTGESKPVSKKEGDAVIAGTINGDGALKVRAVSIGEKTFLAGIMRLVAEAQASKSRLQILSDKAALYLTGVAVGGGAITLVAWLLAGAEVGFAVARLVAVLVIACPHALGLAVPLVASISTTKAAQNGFLVKQRIALEAARTIDTVLFDKTGTLTKGEYGVQTIISNSQFLISNDDILKLAAAVDAHSEHPVARAIMKEAEKQDIKISEVKNFVRIPGKGAKGEMEGATVWVGGEKIIEEAGVGVSEELKTKTEMYGKKGHTIIYVLKNRELMGAIALADVIREESKEAVRALHKAGMNVAMVTGDSEDVAKWVAEELEIDSYFANVLPEEKVNIVKKLQEENGGIGNWKLKIENSRRRRVVAMVGDGVNDAPALTQANVGIAIGAGTNVAIESAGIILVKNDPRDIGKIINLSRMTYSKMIQNLFWATGYNVIAMPLAAGALAFKGIVLEPALAAMLMSVSTVIVAVNALFLKRRKI